MELSRRLGISPTQLSELLNSHYGSSFNRFVNAYRVEEMKSLLGTDGNILQMAFDCGFNSKTAFKGAFKSFIGMTPSPYCQKNYSRS